MKSKPFLVDEPANSNFSRMDNSSIIKSDTSEATPVIYLSDETRQLIQLINYVVFCDIITLFGVGSNIVNITVFIKQGFKDSINISLLGLGISDLCSSLAILWTSICYNPLLLNLELSFDVMDVMYMTGGWPHVCFNRITSFITAFITLERCLCIAMPLKVKTIITPSRTKAIIGMIFLSMFSLFTPTFFVNKLEWVHNPSRNVSVYSLVFAHNRGIVDSVTFFIHSVALSSLFLITVTICTIILVVKLNQKTKWRTASVSQAATKQETTSGKEKRVVKMVIIISTIFIVSYIPPTINFMVMVFFPDFSITGGFMNVFHATWSAVFVLEAVNSSVNIFVYYTMSSKFKATFRELSCGISNIESVSKSAMFANK